MKIFVVYDARGNVRSFAVPGRDAPGEFRLQPSRGRLVSEVEVPGLDKISSHDPKEQLRHVSEELETQRVKRSRDGSATLAGC